VDEIRVFLDGCTDDSETLKNIFPEVHWYGSKTMTGASGARSILYKTAKGKILFGFDDDAHPLQPDFIEITQQIFNTHPKVGLIAYKEIKGVFDSEFIPENLLKKQPDLLVNDFVGCGFAVQKTIYECTRGFPSWIDIYGEEVCLAVEILDIEKEILYTHQIQVNHRVDIYKRKKAGAGYFRFEKQLKNTTWFYLVYYPFPLLLKKIGKLYFHNLKKYGFKDLGFCKGFFRASVTNLFYFGNILKFRRPVKEQTLIKFNQLAKPQY